MRFRIREHGGRGPSHVGPDGRDEASLACRSADDPVLPGKVRHEVLVEAVAQEGPADPGVLQVLLGGVVLAGQGELRIG